MGFVTLSSVVQGLTYPGDWDTEVQLLGCSTVNSGTHFSSLRHFYY